MLPLRCECGIQPLLQSKTPNHISKRFTTFTACHCLPLAQKPIVNCFLKKQTLIRIAK